MPGRIIASGRRLAIFPLSLSPALWLDATRGLYQERTGASATTVCTANDPVGTWGLRTAGAGIYAVAATDAKRPAWKTGVQNGLPMVRPDASDDYLATGSIAHGVGTGDFYWGGVIRTGSSLTGYRSICGNGTYSPGLYLQAGKINMYWGGDSAFSNFVSTSTTYLIECWRQSGVLKAAINGVQEAATLSVATSMADGAFELFRDGSITVGNIDIGEWLFLVGSGFLSQMTALRSYFSGRWAY